MFFLYGYKFDVPSDFTCELWSSIYIYTHTYIYIYCQEKLKNRQYKNARNKQKRGPHMNCQVAQN